MPRQGLFLATLQWLLEIHSDPLLPPQRLAPGDLVLRSRSVQGSRKNKSGLALAYFNHVFGFGPVYFVGFWRWGQFWLKGLERSAAADVHAHVRFTRRMRMHTVGERCAERRSPALRSGECGGWPAVRRGRALRYGQLCGQLPS